MKLSPHEIQSNLWKRLTEHYIPLLAKHRARLENPLITEHERIALCYQIKSIRDFLALAEPEQKRVTAQG